MGEKAHLPHENGMNNENQGSGSDQEMDDNENEDEFDDMSAEEFQMLDNQLDALNSALDDIEQKNDDIHAQLLALLQSNRDIRKQMQQSNNSNAPPGAPGKEDTSEQSQSECN